MSDNTPASTEIPATPASPSFVKISGRPTPVDGVNLKLRSNSLFMLLLPVLVVIAVAVLGNLYWQQHSQLATLQTNTALLTQQSAANNGQFSALQQSQQQLEQSLVTAQQQDQNQQQVQQQNQVLLVQANAQISSLTAQLASMNQQLLLAQQAIRNQGNNTSAKVQLSEAASMLRLAEQRLLMTSDVNTAITLLQEADAVLKQINSPALVGLQNNLAADLFTLQALTTINVEALYEKLASVSAEVEVLTMVSGSDNPDFLVPESTGAPTTLKQNGWIDSALSVLSEYFVVTRQDVAVSPLLTTEQQFLLRKTIGLQLTSAQLSLLNSQQVVYDAALAAAQAGISRWIENSDSRKIGVLAELEALRTSPITNEIPAINLSQQAIKLIEIGMFDAPVEVVP
jgi:uroporphyrin-III C-methyltransferase